MDQFFIEGQELYPLNNLSIDFQLINISNDLEAVLVPANQQLYNNDVVSFETSLNNALET